MTEEYTIVTIDAAEPVAQTEQVEQVDQVAHADPTSAAEDDVPTFKAFGIMNSYANLLYTDATNFITKISPEMRKKRKSTIMKEFSLPGGSDNIREMYYAGTTATGELIEPTQANGGFPIVLLVMGPKRSRVDVVKVTALTLCNNRLAGLNTGYSLTASKGRIYLNW